MWLQLMVVKILLRVTGAHAFLSTGIWILQYLYIGESREDILHKVIYIKCCMRIESESCPQRTLSYVPKIAHDPNQGYFISIIHEKVFRKEKKNLLERRTKAQLKNICFACRRSQVQSMVSLGQTEKNCCVKSQMELLPVRVEQWINSLIYCKATSCGVMNIVPLAIQFNCCWVSFMPLISDSYLKCQTQMVVGFGTKYSPCPTYFHDKNIRRASTELGQRPI